MEELERKAKQLYEAVAATLKDPHLSGLLGAVGDARAGVPWERAVAKSRVVFLALSDNLTRIQARG